MNAKLNTNTNPMFNFEGHDVRVVMIKNQPWFVVGDVLAVFGLHRGGKNLITLEPKDILVIGKKECDQITFDLFLGKTSRITLISEAGLYKFVMRSDKPTAKRFQNWLANEVLPALRKDGMYVMGEEKVKTGEMSLENFCPSFAAAPSTSSPLALQAQEVDGGSCFCVQKTG